MDLLPRKELFWDVDVNSFDFRSHPEFIAERVASKGSISDIKWYFQIFGEEMFSDSIERSRNCSAEVKSFWKIFRK